MALIIKPFVFLAISFFGGFCARKRMLPSRLGQLPVPLKLPPKLYMRDATPVLPGKVVNVGEGGRDIDVHVANRAAEIIHGGGIVAFPTDTLYGVACDAWNPVAIRRIYELKGRAASQPLAIAIADAKNIGSFTACESDSTVAHVVQQLLPGPFTIILPRGEALLPELNPGVETIGVRVIPPSAPCATAICRALGNRSALALTSANPSGGTSPLDIGDFANIHEGIDLMLDGGRIPTASRAGSTIVKLSPSGEFSIVREGLAGGAARVTKVAEAAGLVAASLPSKPSPS